VYMGRNLDELSMVPLSEWDLQELSYHHYIMAQMAPLMNQQGISLHHQLIREIERRGGLAALDDFI
jgi:hypothetical protein